MIEKKGFAGRLRASLRGKSVHIVLCEIVLEEVKRVRGLGAADVVSNVSRLMRRKVIVLPVDDSQRILAYSTTSQYQFCHRGDNLILALCSTKNFVLMTFDRMLLKACEITGIAAFHPAKARGI